MKAYNQQWIYNREIVRQAGRWYKRGLFTNAQLTAVQQAYPVGFRQTNGILEIGLFLFTTLAVLGTFLLLMTIVSESLDQRTSFGVYSLVFGIGLGILGWRLINRQKLYRNGVDNAFAVLTTGFLAFALLLFMPENLTIASYCVAILPFLGLALWYYGDTILAFLTLATFYTTVFDGMLQISWGKAALSFVIMGVSALLYITINRINRYGTQPQRTADLLYYADPLNLIESLSLVMLAAGGNYFVVRELNALLLGSTSLVTPEAAPKIALPGLFWLLTFAIPGAYLTGGLRKKDRLLISLGGIGLVAAVATLHEYAALVSLNVALVVGGLLLTGIVVACIRYLRAGPNSLRYGFTDAPDDDLSDAFALDGQLIATIQATSMAQQIPKDDMRFGSGEFGGAGSEGTY